MICDLTRLITKSFDLTIAWQLHPVFCLYSVCVSVICAGLLDHFKTFREIVYFIPQSAVCCMVAQVFTEIHYRRVDPVELSAAIAIGGDSTEASPILAEAVVVVVKTEKLH